MVDAVITNKKIQAFKKYIIFGTAFLKMYFLSMGS